MAMEDKMKNIVVLKNLPSNLVEEAIVILKQDRKNIKCVENNNLKKEIKNCGKPKDYIVKEAEMVISNYISGLEEPKAIKQRSNKKLEKRYKFMKFAIIVMSIVLIIKII